MRNTFEMCGGEQRTFLDNLPNLFKKLHTQYRGGSSIKEQIDSDGEITLSEALKQ